MQRYSLKSIRITDLKNVLIRHATSTLLFQEIIPEKYTVVQPVPKLWPRKCSSSENGKAITRMFDYLLCICQLPTSRKSFDHFVHNILSVSDPRSNYFMVILFFTFTKKSSITAFLVITNINIYAITETVTVKIKR